MSGTFDLREHTADVAVAARAADPGALFAAVADGMAAAMCEDVPVDAGERFEIAASASTPKRLLYDYLDALIYERDVRGVLPVDSEASVERADGEWTLVASARGVPIDAVAARDLKAVTFSEMTVERDGVPVEADAAADPGAWRAYVVFDV